MQPFYAALEHWATHHGLSTVLGWVFRWSLSIAGTIRRRQHHEAPQNIRRSDIDAAATPGSSSSFTAPRLAMRPWQRACRTAAQLPRATAADAQYRACRAAPDLLVLKEGSPVFFFWACRAAPALLVLNQQCAGPPSFLISEMASTAPNKWRPLNHRLRSRARCRDRVAALSFCRAMASIAPSRPRPLSRRRRQRAELRVDVAITLI